MKLVALVGLLAATALAYSVLLNENPPAQSGPSVVDRLFAALALGAAVCLTVFLGGLIWYRALTNHLCRECRQFVLTMIEQRKRPSAETSLSQRPAQEPVRGALTVDITHPAMPAPFAPARHAA